MTPLSEHTPSRWRIFTAAPHRIMFFGGALQAVAAMLWWLVDLSTRYGMQAHIISWPVTPVAAHAYLLIYQGEFVLPINSRRIKRLNIFLNIHAQLALNYHLLK